MKYLTLLMVVLCTSCSSGGAGSYSMKSMSMHAKCTTQPGDPGQAYDEAKDAAGAAPLIDHMDEYKDKDSEDGTEYAAFDSSKDFSEDDDYWYTKEEDGTIIGTPKPKTA